MTCIVQLSEMTNMAYSTSFLFAIICLLGLKIVALPVSHNFTLSILHPNYPTLPYMIHRWILHAWKQQINMLQIYLVVEITLIVPFSGTARLAKMPPSWLQMTPSR